MKKKPGQKWILNETQIILISVFPSCFVIFMILIVMVCKCFKVCLNFKLKCRKTGDLIRERCCKGCCKGCCKENKPNIDMLATDFKFLTLNEPDSSQTSNEIFSISDPSVPSIMSSSPAVMTDFPPAVMMASTSVDETSPPVRRRSVSVEKETKPQKEKEKKPKKTHQSEKERKKKVTKKEQKGSDIGSDVDDL